jgi:hypothetical protein
MDERLPLAILRQASGAGLGYEPRGVRVLHR